MNWRNRRNKFYGESKDGQLDYGIFPKRNSKFYITAHMPGGAEHRLPYQDFDTAQDAMDWVENYEQKRMEQAERYRNQEPIRF